MPVILKMLGSSCDMQKKLSVRMKKASSHILFFKIFQELEKIFTIAGTFLSSTKYFALHKIT